MSISTKLFQHILLPALGRETAETVSEILEGQLTDRSQRLQRALQKSNDRTWRTLEMALAGDSLWDRVKGLLSQGDERAFRRQLRGFLEIAPLPDLCGKDDFRRQCLSELQTARKQGLLRPLGSDAAVYVRQVGALASFDDPARRLDAESRAVKGIADDLEQLGYKSLAWLLNQRPAGGQSLLVLATRYFFRREVEEDEELARSLTFSQLDSLSRDQEEALRGLNESLERHGQLLGDKLADVLNVAAEARDAAVAGLQTALDLQAEQQRQGQVLGGLYESLQKLLAQNQLHNRPVRHGDSLSIRDNRERQLVGELLGRYRALTDEQQRAAPALLNGVGKLELAIGDFDEAQEAFSQAAEYASAPSAKAEAHYNAYRAALEGKHLYRALGELCQALELDRDRFAPFPLDKYEPKSILGVGGFGATFLCRHHLTGAPVAIKALLPEGLERDMASVFKEAAALEQVPHPAIVRVRDYGFADPARTRPYIVMEYFAGKTLEDYVRENGCLSVEELKPLVRPIAEALQAAHGQGILHRDVKPANLLVLKEGSAWQVRLIDFGLALKQTLLASAPGSAARGRSVMESAIAGTLDFAAPEQLGKLPGERVGPQADIYGFAKTCCYALFETTEPTYQDWQKIPTEWADLLGRCLQKSPDRRPARFQEVLRALDALPAPALEAILVSPPPLPPSVTPLAQARPARDSARRSPQVHPSPPVRADYRAPAGEQPPEGTPVLKRIACCLTGAVMILFIGTPIWMLTESHFQSASVRVGPGPRSLALLALGGVFGAGLLARISWGKVGVFAAVMLVATCVLTPFTALFTLFRNTSEKPAFPNIPSPPSVAPGPQAPGPQAPGKKPAPLDARPEEAVALLAFGPEFFPQNVPWGAVLLAGRPDLSRSPAETEIRKALDELASANVPAAFAAAEQLAKMTPSDRHRQEVADSLLRAAQTQRAAYFPELAIKALAVWGTREQVPGLIAALDTERYPAVRAEIMKAMVAIKDERATESLARRLKDLSDRNRAAEALKSFGPAAEKAVLPYVKQGDRGTRIKACEVIEAIGTSESVPELQAVTTDRDKGVRDAAQKALDAASGR